MAAFSLIYHQRVEAFRFILANTPGNDLESVLWAQSGTAESWLVRRGNYTRSLAVMVGECGLVMLVLTG